MAAEHLSITEARRRFTDELTAYIEQRAAGADYRQIAATGLGLSEQLQYQRIVDLMTADHGAVLWRLLQVTATAADPGGAA